MVLTILSQLMSLFILIGVGFYIGKRRILDDHSMGQVSGLINNILNPMLGLSSAIAGYHQADHALWLQVFGFAVIMFLITIVISFLVAPRFERRKGQRELYQTMVVFSNLGFIGIPIVRGCYGAEYAIYVLAFLMAYNLFFYTFGVTLIGGEFSLAAFRKILNPGFLGGILAVILFFFEIPLPAFLVQSINYMGDLVSPLAMIAIGFTVAGSDVKRIFTNGKIYLFCLFRMILLPLIFIPILKLFPFDSTLVGISLIEIGMPIGSMNLIIGTEYHLDCSEVSAAIIMSTAMSVVTLPILLALVG